MASLTGTKIKDTYDGLLKTTDNGALGASAKLITDGLGNSSGVYLGTSGNVGIGTNNPQVLFQADLKASGDIAHFEGNGSVHLTIGESSNNMYLNANNGNATIEFQTNGNERMRIDSSGNVGIGYSGTAKGKVDIRTTVGSTFLNLQGTNETSNGETALIRLWGTQYNSAGRHSEIANVTSGSTASNNLVFRTNATERMRINSNGVLQIGSGAAYSAGINGKIQLTTGSVNGSGIAVAHGLNAADQYWTIGGQYSEGNANNRAEIRYAIDGSDTKTRISFHTANGAGTINEAARITSGGYLKASNTGSYLSSTGTYHELRQDAGTAMAVFTNINASTPFGLSVQFTAASPNNTTQNFFECYDSTESKLIIYSNGTVVNRTGTYTSISDIKVKENIVDSTPKLDKLMQTRIVNYNLIGDDLKQIGVVAQELEQVFPSLVFETPDTEEREVEVKDENGNIVYETEQVLVSEAVAEYTETIEHAEELDEDGNVIAEAWTEEIVHPAKEAVYETVTTDRPVMTTERVDLGTTTKAVKYSVFVPILIKAMQEQQEIIQSQGDLIKQLEARIAALEAR